MKIENVLMKSVLSVFVLGAFLSCFVSCTKELSLENPVGTQPGTKGDFYATIDGNQWNADSLQLIFLNNGGVSINGLSKTGDQISMILSSFKVSTYTLNATSDSYVLFGNVLSTPTSVFVSNSGNAGGTVVISSIDTINHLVSGSFQFNLVNPADNSTKSITKGVFAFVPYTGWDTSVVVPPPVDATDTLNATIGGSAFISVEATATPTGSNQLLLGGVNAAGTGALELLMPQNITAGTYAMDYAGGMYVGVFIQTSNPTDDLVSQQNGTLTIISNNTTTRHINGTFSFQASSLMNATAVSVTNGYFGFNY